MAESNCWYVNFAGLMTYLPPGSFRRCLAERVADKYPPGCFIVQEDSDHRPDLKVIVMGGGKTGAHQKRRAALKVPDAEWVKHSEFVIREASP